MAIFSFLFGSTKRSSRALILPHDEDGNDHDCKALLADQDGHLVEAPPHYRSKHRSGISIIGFGIAFAIVIGLITMCVVWYLSTQKSQPEPHDMLAPNAMHSTVNEAHRHSIIPADILDKLEHAEELGSEFEEARFAGWKDCGSSVEEARAKSCFFDVMLHSWVNEECADKELMDEYLTKVPYHWYRDWKSKEEITVEEMRRGEHGTAAVKVEEHGTHCAYVLEKNMRALMNGKPLARSIYSIKHAVHCLGLLVDPSTIPGDFTQVVVEYDQCGIPQFD